MSIRTQTDIADVLQSSADKGEIRLDLGDVRDDSGISAESPMWVSDGFISRPNDPNEDGACQAFYIQDANDKRIIATYDARFSGQVGKMNEGDRAIVTDSDARIVLKKERDSISIITTNMAEDTTMLLDVSGVDGEISILNHEASIKMYKDKITLGISGGSMITIGKDGIFFDGPYFGCNMGGGNLGLIAPKTVPVKVANSIIAGPTGMAGVGAPNWVVSPT